MPREKSEERESNKRRDNEKRSKSITKKSNRNNAKDGNKKARSKSPTAKSALLPSQRQHEATPRERARKHKKQSAKEREAERHMMVKEAFRRVQMDRPLHEVLGVALGSYGASAMLNGRDYLTGEVQRTYMTPVFAAQAASGDKNPCVKELEHMLNATRAPPEDKDTYRTVVYGALDTLAKCADSHPSYFKTI